ncbi:hypothetical protein CES86_1290 [Brucella lupini]|uniref:Uncharacterized protein n=1 Tax=Brucella lupini TaxID=255457 RepID=A0A256GWR3_9HYPH|nr:hypothetical protein CES86_1290 [Brucella lupini]
MHTARLKLDGLASSNFDAILHRPHAGNPIAHGRLMDFHPV